LGGEGEGRVDRIGTDGYRTGSESFLEEDATA
jgi:hypothetical protein